MTTFRDIAKQRRLAWLVAALVLLSLGSMFRRPLFRGEVLLFRDAAHFYPPLWEWARGEWAARRIPLWNPYQNLGEPHLADNSSSVFYPGKLLFTLPMDFQRLYVLFLVGHLGLAATTMFWLVRRWGGSVTAGGIAALSYALSGNVLFQYCNAPFLIGAAWLPLAIDLSWRFLADRTFQRMVQLAAVLSMMVLGGDSQMVVNVGLGLLLLCVMRCRTSGWQAREATSLLWVFGLTGVVVCLAAIQIFPTSQQTLRSSRLVAKNDRPNWLARPVPEASTPGSRESDVYDFSVGPWRWAELCWPNVGGRMFPTNARWMNVIPAEGRVWTPSLYFGLLPFALAAVQLRRYRRLELRYRWIVVCTLLAVWAGLGRFGLGWLAAEARFLLGWDSELPVGWPFGGLYWLMTMLPVYQFFRYPAKLWVLATCGFSLLAAHGWDRLRIESQSIDIGFPANGNEDARVATTRMLAIIGLLSGGLGATLYLLRPHLLASIDWSRHVDKVFGRLDGSAGMRQVFLSLTVAATLAAIFWWLLRRPRWPLTGPIPSTVVLLICVLDLFLAHHWLILSGHVAGGFWSTDDSPIPQRIYRCELEREPPVEPPENHGFVRVVEWERETMFPQYQHAARRALLKSPTTIPSRDVQSFLDVLEESIQRDGAASPVAKCVAIDWIIDRGGVKQVQAVLPRAWIATEIRPVEAWLVESGTERTARMRAVWMGDPQVDLGQTVFVDSATGNWPRSMTGGQCQITEYLPRRVVVRLSGGGPGMLVLSDQYAPGWRAWVKRRNEWESQPILRTNRVLRGVLLRGDESEVLFRYVPGSFYVGAVLSGIAWGWLIGWRGLRQISKLAAGS